MTRFLKVTTVSKEWSGRGREFQSWGATALKDLSLRLLKRAQGTISRFCPEDLRLWDELYGWSSSINIFTAWLEKKKCFYRNYVSNSWRKHGQAIFKNNNLCLCAHPVLTVFRLKPNQNSLFEWKDMFKKGEQEQEVFCTSAMSPSERYKDKYKEHDMLVIELRLFFPFAKTKLHSVKVVAQINKRN